MSLPTTNLGSCFHHASLNFLEEVQKFYNHNNNLSQERERTKKDGHRGPHSLAKQPQWLGGLISLPVQLRAQPWEDM